MCAEAEKKIKVVAESMRKPYIFFYLFSEISKISIYIIINQYYNSDAILRRHRIKLGLLEIRNK